MFNLSSIFETKNTITIQDNVNMIQDIKVVDGSLNIPVNASYTLPITVNKNGKYWEITLKAERKLSWLVASMFPSASSGSTHVYAPKGGGSPPPKELHFFFAVSITFQVATELKVDAYVTLGQGHFFVFNNWWIGGQAVERDAKGNGRFKLTTPTGDIKFELYGGTDLISISWIT